ncbi:heme/hemin ABC transporter substrate-binding protein [Gordonia sp. CPCC 205333]|uniref:heme/hemin ABC transporter substrate-binding protein n=1 Tax=Gordonia sp. CPCC 205333 TaxID=3140790 RepID=UPI003AF3F304
MLAVGTVVATILVLTGCTTAPLDNGGASSSATSRLRSGPSTATLDGPAVVPIANDPVPALPATADSVATGSHPAGKVTVTDTSRIVAVDRNGTLGNIVFSLGLGSRVVGRDMSTTFPQAATLPLVTNRGHSLNAEATLALNPSVVLIDSQTIPPQAVEQIRSSGIPVVAFSSTRTIESTPALIASVATALGVPDVGAKLVTRTKSQIDAMRAALPSPTGDPRMAFLYIRGPRLILLAGPNSGADNLVAALGGQDAGTASGLTGAFTAVNAEALANANPDVILVMSQGADSVGGIDGVLKLPGLSDTNAGKARRIVSMDETEILSFGPDVGRVLQALAKSIYQ